MARPQRTCTFDECKRRHHARGLCHKHNMRRWRGNDPAVERTTERELDELMTAAEATPDELAHRVDWSQLQLREAAERYAWTSLTCHLIRKAWVPSGVLDDSGSRELDLQDARQLVDDVTTHRETVAWHRIRQGHGELRPTAAPPSLPRDELLARLVLLWDAWVWDRPTGVRAVCAR